jgi:hypothetical protein
MKNLSLYSLLAGAFLAASPLHAATEILSNNFNSISTGSYNGTLGVSLGTDALSGNATGRGPGSLTINATGGVGNSQVAYGTDIALRSRNTLNFKDNGTQSFSLYFKYGSGSTRTSGQALIGAGWATANGTDGINTYGSNAADRVTVGLGYTTGSAISIATTSLLSQSTNLTGGGGDVTTISSLTSGNWYQMSFSLLFNYNSGSPGSSTYTVSSFALTNRGTDGLLNGSVVLSLASAEFNPGNGGNLDTNHNNYAFIMANQDRGANLIDNVSVIPEPATWALLAFSLTTVMILRRRRQS